MTADLEWALQQVRERRLLIDRVDQWIYDTIAPYLGARVLEVGCGLGNLIRILLDRDLVIGIDIAPDAIACLQQAYANHSNVQFHTYDINDPQILELRSLAFDTIVSLNLLEHVQDDVLALSHMRQLLQPGGHLVLIVPAHAWLYGTMDGSIGHHRRYDKALMAEKLTKAEFTPIMQRYLNAIGALGWFMNGRILRQQVPPGGQLRMFNRLVPAIRAIECALPPPMGISLVTVAK